MPENTAPSTPTAPRHRWRAALVIVGIVAVLGASMALAPVRTFAVQVLSVFRVQKIATVSITEDDLTKISDSLENGDSHVSLKELGDVWVEGKLASGGAEVTPTTLSAAQAAVDFPVLTPAGIEGTQTVLVQPAGSVKFRLHVDKVNELLHYYGAEKVFSRAVDGKTFQVDMPPTVYISWGSNDAGPADGGPSQAAEGDGTPKRGVEVDPSSSDVLIAETRGPQLTVPDGVNPLELRDVLLGLPFLPESVRTQLSGVSEWQSTLIVPNLAGSTREVTVAGHPGVVIGEPVDPDMSPEDRANYASPVAVMWQQDGVLRAVATSSEARSLKIAESMAR
jgi:hypothetical protein